MSKPRTSLMIVPFFFLLPFSLHPPAPAIAAAGPPYELLGVLAVDRVGVVEGLPSAADLLSVGLYQGTEASDLALRLSFLSLSVDPPGLATARSERVESGPPPGEIPLRVEASRGGAGATLAAVTLKHGGDAYLVPDRVGGGASGGAVRIQADDPDAVWLRLDRDLVRGATAAEPLRFVITTLAGETLAASYPPARAYEAHCAFVLHGNQGLGYTDVFHGRGDDLEGSGFDEALQIHQSTTVPGNFHLAGTLQSSAEWQYNNGDPIDFNGWLANGVASGWAGLMTSAFAQHIMPFVNNDMNDWSVYVLTQMTNFRYGYFPLVGWVPERVWLSPSAYPSAGVSDWIGDNWQPHGVGAVILDDDVHLSGHDNHQIHFLAGNGLRLIARDRSFTGNIVGGNGQASLDILTNLAGSGVGEYRIVTFAEDWEAIAEMGIWATTTPFAKETYDWFIQKCADESAWLHTWKLADAMSNPNFNGATFTPNNGTYGEIGGADGYGGGNNGWYTHWAGFIPYANGGDGAGACAGGGGNCKNYGTLWNDAFNALAAAPENNVSQAGWYVLMTNLHETGWHDGMGGPISGWQHKYSAHIKNATIYAEAAHWANNEYASTTAAFWSDIDNDGYDEVVVHNDRLLAVFETIGGRATHLFVKGPGFNDTAIGVDNAYWSGTEGDYNDDNHVGAFSDVSPNYQHEDYSIEIVSGTGPTVRLRLTKNELTKDVSLSTGDSFLDVVYRVGPATHWLRSGFSPSLVDLIWNAQLSRIWVSDAAYMGQRNPNTGVAVAWVTGTGGADHQMDFSGTLMKGDELKGSGTFQCKLFAGPTSPPDGSGEILELRALANATDDTIGPGPVAAQYFAAAEILRVTFDQQVDPVSVDPTGFGVDEDGDGVAEVTLTAGAAVHETSPSYILAFQLEPATVAALDLLAPANLLLLVDAGSAFDVNANGNAAVTAAAAVGVAVIDTRFPIDGLIEPGDWVDGFSLPDSNDSGWTAANEIDGLYVSWDEVYLYVALDGIVYDNSWLIYFDIDPGTANGETDLAAIDAWERGATFVASGFAADFQYGCYQHQGSYDSDSFFEILSATTTQDRSAEIVSAFDSQHVYGSAGGSELAIPWNTLYGLGDNAVPPGASVSFVASLCWDPEPDGVLGGDSAPSNLASSLPEIDHVWTVMVDRDEDGAPDRLDLVGLNETPLAGLRLLPATPNPFNPLTTISFELPVDSDTPVMLAIYDLQGRSVKTLLSRPLPAGRHSAQWDGRDERGRPVAAGTYISSLRYRGQVKARPLSLIK